MKRKLTTFFTLIFGLTFAQSATAETNMLLMNMLEGKVSVNGAAYVDGQGGGIWSPLDALIIHSGNQKAYVKDMHQQCSGGGWKIRGQASVINDYCLHLGFAEIGCVVAILGETNGKYEITIEKVAGRLCSDQWYNSGGKKLLTDAYELYTKQTKLAQDGTKAAADFISAIK